MKIVPYVRQKPDIQSEWGNYASPYIVYNPSTYRNRRPLPPDRTQGRHAIRNEPRPVGIRSMVTGARPGIEGPTAAYSGYNGHYEMAPGHGLGKVGFLKSRTTLELVLMAGALGLFGYFIYKHFLKEDSGVRENPIREYRRSPGKVRYRKSQGRVKAAQSRKCRECGKFISKAAAQTTGLCKDHAALAAVVDDAA
jgi:hypothetical protein